MKNSSCHCELNRNFRVSLKHLFMEEQPKFPDLTDAERKVLEDFMPDEISEIITSGIKRRHFLKLISFTGTGRWPQPVLRNIVLN